MASAPVTACVPGCARDAGVTLLGCIFTLLDSKHESEIAALGLKGAKERPFNG